MRISFLKKRGWLICLVLMIVLPATVQSQSLLSRNVSLEVKRQRLDHVLEILSNKGDFYFSYSSYVVRKDSLISLSVHNRPVREVLSQLFNNTYEFIESGNYIIIRKAPIRVTMITHKAVEEDRIYMVTGYVYDEATGAALHDASVYEKRLLAATLTNPDGFFKLKLKGNRKSTASLTVSKEFYEDTTVLIEPRHNQQLTITLMPYERPDDQIIISPEDYLNIDTGSPALIVQDTAIIGTVTDVPELARVEKTRVGKFFLTAGQKVQSLNLKNFFTKRPFQVSLVPGLSTHGNLGSQVVNNFSLNLFGGYTAGTNGVEIGGLFNIDQKDVRYVQIGGMFNVVGGEMRGFQVAGMTNTVLKPVKGFQVGGVNNYVKGSFTGFQVAGVYNHVTDSVLGLQIGGVANFARRTVSGVQLAGVINFSNRETRGVQISGVFNYTKRLKGVQIGLINIADSSDGYSIGLINIVLKGYHKLSIWTNEWQDYTAAFKTGNRRLYSILLAGMNIGTARKRYSFGYGLGSEWGLGRKQLFSLNPELTTQYIYMGSWDYCNILSRIEVNFNVHLGKWVSVFAGPSYNIYKSDQTAGIDTYKYPLPGNSYSAHTWGKQTKGWFGWQAGISFF
ncbi:MAG: hypothetical protein KA821_11590 [Chitinophagaceae bacterium]|nr:hypothetical protein [Chitinophagaceae bacterium]